MFRALLAKDFARARRNPLPWVIFLLAPLCVAGIIGFAFGGGAKEQKISRIRFALVDEDDTIVSRFLRGGLNQGNLGGERRSDVPDAHATVFAAGDEHTSVGRHVEIPDDAPMCLKHELRR